METDGLQWNDHVSQFTEEPCPISFSGSDEFSRFLKVNNHHHIVALITKLKSLQAFLATCRIAKAEYVTMRKRQFQLVQRIKMALNNVAFPTKQFGPEEATSRICSWWRKCLNLKRQRRAVVTIEAWWIGTSVKRKIARALEAGKSVCS